MFRARLKMIYFDFVTDTLIINDTNLQSRFNYKIKNSQRSKHNINLNDSHSYIRHGPLKIFKNNNLL